MEKIIARRTKNRIQGALSENIHFSKDISLGYPGSKLDGKVFYDNAPFLKEPPTLLTFVANPNHIGCHTLGDSESYCYQIPFGT